MLSYQIIKGGSIVVVHIFSPSNEQNESGDVLELWSEFLKRQNLEINQFQLRKLLKHVLDVMDQEGVYWGTMRDLTDSTELTAYVIRKHLQILNSYNLIFRRYGMIMLNTKAFTADGLLNRREDFLL